MTTWYTTADGRLKAYTMRPDLWPPGWEVRLEDGPAVEWLVADWGSDGVQLTRTWLSRPDMSGPGVAEALILAGVRVDTFNGAADDRLGAWVPWINPGLV